MDFQHLLLSLEGRITKKSFWIGILILTLAGIMLLSMLAKLQGIEAVAIAGEKRSKELIKLDIVVSLLMLYPVLAVMGKRLHDRGRGMFWAVLLFGLSIAFRLAEYMDLLGSPTEPSRFFMLIAIPMSLLTLWMIIELGFFNGDKGDNRYGPDPLAVDAQQDEDNL